MEISEAIKRIKNEMSERGLIERVSTPEKEALYDFYFGMLLGIGYDEGCRQITHRKAVAQYDMEGKFIKIYGSATLAAKKVGRHKSSICKAARGDTPYSGGFIWKYVLDGTP